MRPAKVALATLLAGTISIGTAIFGERWLAQRQSSKAPPVHGHAQLQALPDLRLPDLDGREIRSSAWAGRVLVLNYWASWCPPCLREIPLMIQAQEATRERGVQFVGIAIDRPEDVRSFVADYPLNYPVLIGNPEAVELSRRLGNRLQGLPFTVIFDAHGRRVYSHAGEIDQAQLTQALDDLLGGRGAAESQATPNQNSKSQS